MLNIARLLPCLFLLVLPLAHAAEPAVAGSVLHIQGAAMVNHIASSANLERNSQILSGDRIVTGRNARVALQMVDGSILTLGADTEFAIEDYRYSAKDKQGWAHLELVKGVFRTITGAIGKLPGRDFKVRTSVGTIGIRGTDFWGGYMFSGALDVALLGGAGVYIENAAGRAEITQTGYGTTVKAADVAPTTPIRWGEKKLNAAIQSVAWEDK